MEPFLEQAMKNHAAHDLPNYDISARVKMCLQPDGAEDMLPNTAISVDSQKPQSCVN